MLYGGFGAKDYMRVEPSIGGEAAWRSFTAAAHKLDLKVISWFNPSYLWTEAPAFVSAQADARKYFVEKVDYDLLPPTSTARWFKWQKTCPGAPGMPVCPAWCRSETQCGGQHCRGRGCGGGEAATGIGPGVDTDIAGATWLLAWWSRRVRLRLAWQASRSKHRLGGAALDGQDRTGNRGRAQGERRGVRRKWG